MRVGLNSGQVIAGEIGSGVLGYTAIGRAGRVGAADGVGGAAGRGDAQSSPPRDWSSTPRCSADTGAGAHQGGRQTGSARAGCWRSSRGMPRSGAPNRAWSDGAREMAAIEAMRGPHRSLVAAAVVGVVGPPGIGKSRVAREAAALAAGRGVEVVWAFCESHASDIPFHVVDAAAAGGDRDS